MVGLTHFALMSDIKQSVSTLGVLMLVGVAKKFYSLRSIFSQLTEGSLLISCQVVSIMSTNSCRCFDEHDISRQNK